MSSSLEVNGSWSSLGAGGRSGCLAFFSLFFFTRPWRNHDRRGDKLRGRSGGTASGGNVVERGRVSKKARIYIYIYFEHLAKPVRVYWVRDGGYTTTPLKLFDNLLIVLL